MQMAVQHIVDYDTILVHLCTQSAFDRRTPSAYEWNEGSDMHPPPFSFLPAQHDPVPGWIIHEHIYIHT